MSNRKATSDEARASNLLRNEIDHANLAREAALGPVDNKAGRINLDDIASAPSDQTVTIIEPVLTPIDTITPLSPGEWDGGIVCAILDNRKKVSADELVTHCLNSIL